MGPALCVGRRGGTPRAPRPCSLWRLHPSGPGCGRRQRPGGQLEVRRSSEWRVRCWAWCSCLDSRSVLLARHAEGAGADWPCFRIALRAAVEKTVAPCLRLLASSLAALTVAMFPSHEICTDERMPIDAPLGVRV